ncbi:MAG: hypothetical protein ACJ798_17085 [Phenylobacterium sp.]
MTEQRPERSPGLPAWLAGLLAVALAAGVSLERARAAEAPAAAPPPAAAPVYTPTSLKAERGLPRTRDGHPDFQEVVWEANFFAPLEMMQPKLAPTLVLPEDQARKASRALISSFLDNPLFKSLIALDPEFEGILNDSKGFPIVRGERRSRLLVLPADGKLPLTPQGAKQGQVSLAALMGKTDNPEERGNLERCVSMGATPPVTFLGGPNPREFVLTRDYVAIHSESGDEVRIIPFTDQHGSRGPRPAFGDSIARWEGDTLVIETTSLPASERRRFSPTGSYVVNPDAKVIERFTRLSRDELLYQFTVEDPKIYASPWLGEYSFFRASYRMFPGNCHEGNYGLPNILAGAREEERARAAAATTAVAAK